MAHFSARLAGAATAVFLIGAAQAAAVEFPFDLGLGGGNDRVQTQPAPAAQPPVLMAQAGDAGVRLSQMEEEIRRLTGRVEEMSFLVLQLQEQLRNAQEDNELRFQDLEGGSGGGGQTPERRSEATPPAAGGSGDGEFALGLPPQGTSAGVNATSGQGDDIGTLLDQASLEDLGGAISQDGASGGSQTVASINANGPVELYSLAYNYMLAGDYQLAEQSFRQYADTYPDSEDASDARYWLGESLFAQNKFRDAAEVFLNAQKAHPESTKAPEMMLKLGMSLARLDNAETACVTYAEVERRYPSMSANVKRKLDEEETAARCS
ncbi:tol-pal system protein YbgF [Aureimonas mangrovi]|uniref:tol-pal system protein YbgF n=1 Tax=Aureimonas mangrovi TaxID=2758041 RepID=UPI00163D9B95|nr:tol-pal system protein YbgF [Aureimonas mangrovi]